MKYPQKTLIALSLPLFLILSYLIVSCVHDPNLKGMSPVCFDTQVLPILQTSCNMKGCHDGTGETFQLTDYQSVKRYVKAGNPSGSSLYQAISNYWGENKMPPNQPLTKLQRSIIEVWIAQGANEVVCSTDTTGGGGGGGPKSSDSVCFVQNILPLFIANCAMSSCHDGLSAGEDDLYALNTYASIRQHVTAFNPLSSAVYLAVNGSGENFMPPPPKSPRTSAQKELMRKWISDGALNSDCPNANCDTSGTIGFTAGIKPIIDNYCVSCHNSSITSGGVNLVGYNQVKLYAETLRNGTPVLVGSIKQLAGFKAMPPSTKLDYCTIRKVELWIAQGKLNN